MNNMLEKHRNYKPLETIQSKINKHQQRTPLTNNSETLQQTLSSQNQTFPYSTTTKSLH